MIELPCRALLLVAAGAILTVIPQPMDSAAASRPKVKVLCLAPGSSQPMPCGSASANSLIEDNLGNAAPAPRYLIFREVDAIGPPRVVRVPISAAPGAAVRVGVSPQLCVSRYDRWRVQLDSGAARPSTIGALTVRC